MKYSQAIVSEKGQVTIPKKVRERLGLKPGQVLEFKADHGKLVANKKGNFDSLDEVVGILKGKIGDIDAYIDEIRGPLPERRSLKSR